MERFKNFIRREWKMLSTKFGTVLVAISSVAAQFAPFDVRIAWLGAVSGFLLILWRGK